jgi:hypothetical protein
MSLEDSLNEIKKTIKERIPDTALVTKVDFEGPEVVIYAKNPASLANGEVVKELARSLRKRIMVRPDASILMPPETARKKIEAIIPEEAGITDIKFDSNFGEVFIEAVKPGLVIGKSGRTLSEVKLAIGWIPRVRRTAPITSKIVKSILAMLLKTSDERKEILRKIGRRIHRTPLPRGTPWVRVSAMGGFREVGRTAIFLHTQESKVLIDCGVNIAAGENENAYPYLNLPEFNLQELDAVVVTHAHLDHCGFVPYLYYMGYEGPVYCTAPTRDLMFLLLWDYLDVTEREGKPLPYPRKFIKKMMKYVIPLNYGEVTDIAPDIRLTLHNSGHILGASLAHFHIGEGLYNLAYTGDIKFERSRLFEAASYRFPRLETLIIESTYGSGENHPSRMESEKQLIQIVKNATRRGGHVLVPVFAVGRAQELMVVLEEYVNQGVLDEVPVYLDGMILEATGILTTYPEYLNHDLRDQIFHRGRNPFLSPIFRRVAGNSMRSEVIEGEPCVVLATSGMLSGGPAMEYLKNWAEDPKNALIFVGYQSEGSLGRRLQKGWKEITMKVNGKTKAVPVNLSVHTVEGFSGHSDRSQLINYIKRINPRPERIITCHGEESRTIEFASTLHKIFRCETRAPPNLEAFRLK